MKPLKTAAYATVFVITSVFGISVVGSLNAIMGTIAENESVDVQGSVRINSAEFESILPSAPNPPESLTDFDPTGGYGLWGGGAAPKGFRDIEQIDIVTREYSDENGVFSNTPVVPSGILVASGSEFAFRKVSVGNREIAFETETVRGIRYEFVGHFPLSVQPICEECEYPPDLEGTISKFKDGKLITTAEIRLHIIDAC